MVPIRLVPIRASTSSWLISVGRRGAFDGGALVNDRAPFLGHHALTRPRALLYRRLLTGTGAPSGLSHDVPRRVQVALERAAHLLGVGVVPDRAGGPDALRMRA